MWCYYRLPYKLTEKSCGRSTVKQQESHQDRNQGVSNFIHSYGPRFRTPWFSGLIWPSETETHTSDLLRVGFYMTEKHCVQAVPEVNLSQWSERGFELCSPRSQSGNLITSYFGESTSGSAGAMPLCINSTRRHCLDSWWLGSPSTHAGKTETTTWTSASW